MNTMRKSLLGACAVFACMGVASADTEGWDFINTFPDRGTWALLDGGKSLPSGAASDDIYVPAHTIADGTVVDAYWRSSSSDDPFAAVDVSKVNDGIVAFAPDLSASANSVSQITTGTLVVRDAVTQEQFDAAKIKAAAGTIASITQEQVDAAQEKVVSGIRIGVSQAEVDNNTFIVQQIERVIDTGYIEATTLAADGDTSDAYASNQAAINAEITIIQAEMLKAAPSSSVIGSANTNIVEIVADIIEVDADNVSDALKALSVAVDTTDIAIANANALDGVDATPKADAVAAAGLLPADVGSDTTKADAVAAADLLPADITPKADAKALAIANATEVKINAQAAVANAVIASLDMSSMDSIANRDAAQKIIDTGVLSEITSGDVVSAWRTTVLGVRTEITQEQVDAAQETVDAGFTVQNASFLLPGMTKVSQELYEYAKAVVNTEESLLKGGYNQGDITTAQAIVDAGVLEKITSFQHAAATVIVGNNNVAEAESLLEEGLIDGVLQSDLVDAQRIVDAQKVLTDVDTAGGPAATSRAAVTQAKVDENVELLNLLLYAKEEFGKSETITFSDEQIDLDTMQAIVKLAEAQILVNAGVLEEVTQEQVEAAQAIVDGGVLEEVTQEQVDAQIEERELFVQIFNNGVKIENPTPEQIEAAYAEYEEYAATYGENVVISTMLAYNIADNDVDAVQTLAETYGMYPDGSFVDDKKVKRFVVSGGVDALKALVNTGNVKTALDLSLDMLTTTTTLNDFVTKIQPDVSGSSAGSTAGVNVVGGAIGGHQQSIVAGSGKYGLKKHSLSVSKQLGVSSGDGIKDTGAWLKVFGSDSEMDMRDSIAGYDADASGVVVGIDKTFDNMTIGAAISVANIDVDGKSIANSKTDSDQYQGTLYGTMMMESFYINGSLAYGHASSDTSRNGLDGVVTGSYDTDIFAATFGLGIPVDMGSMAIIPQATMSYASISPDGYTESGIGALHVNVENMNTFGIKAGVAVISKIALDGGIVSPQVRLMADWDVTQEKSVVNSSWVGDVDDTIYSTSGAEPASLGAIFGAGVDYASNDGLYVLSLGYDLSTKSDFVSHTGSAKFRVNF